MLNTALQLSNVHPKTVTFEKTVTQKVLMRNLVMANADFGQSVTDSVCFRCW